MPEPSLSASKEYKRAFSLAFYILGEVDQAKEVASKVASTHSKELKKLIKNRKPKKHRKWSRVLPNTEFNLDMQTYIKSIKYEQRQEREHWERSRMLDDERMTIRFIKHLILEGLKRNSSYLNVGLGRLVFYHSYENIGEIQQLLAQSSDDLPDADRYRKHRQLLFESLNQRFNDEQQVGGRFLRFEPFSQYQDAVILARGNSSEYYPLVKTCLTVFTPESPLCSESLHMLDPQTDILEPFYFDAQTMDRAAEHAIERNRMHAVICQTCFDFILSALNIGEAENNLRLPLFSLDDDGGDSCHSQLQQSPSRSPKKRQQAEETVRRSENLMLDKIVITVDDVRREHLDINNPQPVRLDLKPGATIIEALGEGDKWSVPLGLIYLDWDPECDQETPAQYELKIDGHCTLEFLISYQMDSDGDEKGAIVMISCVAAAKPLRAYAHG